MLLRDLSKNTTFIPGASLPHYHIATPMLALAVAETFHSPTMPPRMDGVIKCWHRIVWGVLLKHVDVPSVALTSTRMFWSQLGTWLRLLKVAHGIADARQPLAPGSAGAR